MPVTGKLLPQGTRWRKPLKAALEQAPVNVSLIVGDPTEDVELLDPTGGVPGMGDIAAAVPSVPDQVLPAAIAQSNGSH